jgi:hypothetical protein
VKRLLLALVVMVLVVPPASPMPLVVVCCGDGECPMEDCRMECGTQSELPVPSRSVSPSPSVASVGKALPAPAMALAAVMRPGLAAPIDIPNLSAGLRPPLRN